MQSENSPKLCSTLKKLGRTHHSMARSSPVFIFFIFKQDQISLDLVFQIEPYLKIAGSNSTFSSEEDSNFKVL